MTNSSEGSRPVRRGRGGMATLIGYLVTAMAVSPIITASAPAVANGSTMALAEQRTSQRRNPDVVVSFEFEQTNATTDEITILFTNLPTAPNRLSPLVFEDKGDQQFSFSGRDYPKAVGFSRRVSDNSFLNSRFIRIVNRGSNRWFPTTISMTVDGRRILDRLSMYPRKGQDPKGGIERWGEPNATFWETDLQRYRSKGD